MKTNLFLILLICSFIGINAFGQTESFTFASSGTTFSLSTNTEHTGSIKIKPGIGEELESTLEKGKEYAIKANTKYTVSAKFSTLGLFRNNLTSLDISGLASLEYLYCGGNNLEDLNLTGLKSLKYIECTNNKFGVCALDELFKNLPKREESSKGKIVIADNNADDETITKCRTYLANDNNWNVFAFEGDLNTGIGVVEINNSEPYGCPEVSDDDVEIQSFTFASSGTTFRLSTNTEHTGSIKIKPGIGEELESTLEKGKEYAIKANTKYTVSAKFSTLGLFRNNLTSLDISGLASLEYLYCGGNNLEDLNLTGLKSLKCIECPNNKFGVCALDELFKNLPKREESSKGKIVIADNNADDETITKCRTYLANDNNWNVFAFEGDLNTGMAEVEINNSEPYGCPDTYILEMLASEQDVKVFPNPVRDALKIESEEIIKQVSLYNISGKLLIQELVNNTNFNLSTAELSRGIYILRIQTDKDTKNIKVIKE